MKLPYRILVLDDDANALSGMVELLRDAEYQVTGAATYDGAKALLTVHPSYLLRIPDDAGRAAERDRFVVDLKRAKALL